MILHLKRCLLLYLNKNQIVRLDVLHRMSPFSSPEFESSAPPPLSSAPDSGRLPLGCLCLHVVFRYVMGLCGRRYWWQKCGGFLLEAHCGQGDRR